MAHSTKQCSYYLKPSRSTTVDLGVDVQYAKVAVGGARPKLGLACMTKKPIDFKHWLSYHYHVVGVSKFFIQVEDTPELAALLLAPPWDACVDVTFVAKTERDYFVQMDRQAVHIASALPRARAAEVDWLIHVDDDELIYCPQQGVGAEALWAALRAMPAHVADVHLSNIEALAPAGCVQPFASCTKFVAATSKFSSYTNGKSIGRVKAPGLRAHGPHHFRAEGAAANQTMNLMPACAVVLHYESCTFDRWCHKFGDLARRHGTDAAVVAKLPFPFYRDSLAVMWRCLHDPANLELRAEALRVWEARKSDAKTKLKPPETVHIVAVRDALAQLFPAFALINPASYAISPGFTPHPPPNYTAPTTVSPAPQPAPRKRLAEAQVPAATAEIRCLPLLKNPTPPAAGGIRRHQAPT